MLSQMFFWCYDQDLCESMIKLNLAALLGGVLSYFREQLYGFTTSKI